MIELTPEAETATFGNLHQAIQELQRHLDERLSALERRTPQDGYEGSASGGEG